jgi:cell division protein FtsW (lipid II flippase)
MVNDEQALLSWIAVTWVVLALCQLAVTVAGNLAVIPLTGVTFPFVSFGMTSLVAARPCSGLCLSVNVPERIDEARATLLEFAHRREPGGRARAPRRAA